MESLQNISILEAKSEAQKLAFGPLYFQTIVALKKLGAFEYIAKHRPRVLISDLYTDLKLSNYGARVLLEAAESANVVVIEENEWVKLTKIGMMFYSDEMSIVNLNFVNDVCYVGGGALLDSIVKGKPEGLRSFGEWKTVYEGLAHLSEAFRKSWFDFDHFYSDQVFKAALQSILKEEPNYIFDIGGNTGKWAIECCQTSEKLRVKILDLPGQLADAEKNVRAKGLEDRVDFHPINLLDKDAVIPRGANAFWMSQFLDCFGEEEIVSILSRVHAACTENTLVYILEPFYDNQKFDAARYCLTGTSLYFTTIANGNSKMYGLDAMKNLIVKSGFEIVEESALLADSYHTLLKCKPIKKD